jgi:hypothetical protein
MSNGADLLNTPSRVADLSTLEGEWLGVAGARARIPIPWFCMFDSSDLEPCTISYQSYAPVDGKPMSRLVKAVILNPSSSVADSKLKLAKSRRIFETLAADATIGHEYWAAAMSQLDRLPLPFLTIDATEILVMDDVKMSTDEFARAFGNDAKAIDLIKKFSCIEDDPSDAALESGFFDPQYRSRSTRTAEARQQWDAALAQMPLDW